jgi:lipopolysaccharide heptosyltransferase I
MPDRPPLHELTARRILLIKPSALGDIVHTLPVLSALRQRFGQAHIAWLVNRAYQPLLTGHPDLDATIAFDRGVVRAGWLKAARTSLALARSLRQERYDLVVDLQGLFRSGLMSLATRAPRRVGLGCSREGARWFYTDVVASPPRRAVHAVDRLWSVAEALGAGGQPKRFVVPIAPATTAWAREQLTGYPRPWLMLAAGSRWPTKRWPPEHFAVLARRAQSVFGGSVVLVGGGDEAVLAQSVRRLLTGPSLDLTGRTSLPQLAAVLARADVMLANDTGPLHLAAALGRPVVAPYTCTQAALTGPYGQPGRAVETRVWCAGSLRRRCDRLECMAELTPGRLWPLLQEVLLSWHSQSRSA